MRLYVWWEISDDSHEATYCVLTSRVLVSLVVCEISSYGSYVTLNRNHKHG